MHADMVFPSTESSNFQRYFAGSTIFVTGATGFLGKLLVEKLLRSCYDLKKIYILVRPKKGKNCEQRFQEYFDDSLYERLKKERPEAMVKLAMMEGDCGLPEMGLSNRDRQIVISEVKNIFHCAATVRFDEKLRTAVNINIRGTKEILKLAKEVKGLNSFVYVSTAFSFCPRQKIDEVFYEPTITADKLLKLVETLSEDQLEEITPKLLGKWPNTYAFSKSVAEDVVKKEGVDLPLAMVRPSIVVSTSKEPVAGWIDNFYGPIGVFVGVHLMGLIRTLNCDPRNLADLVPADYVVNCIIAAAWDVAGVKVLRSNTNVCEQPENQRHSNIPIYNYVSAPQNPFTWNDSMTLGFRYAEAVASPLQLWHSMFFGCPSKYMYLVLHYGLHILPAYIADFFALCIGKKPRCVTTYKKVEKYLNVVGYFGVRQWFFQNKNTQKLWNRLNLADKKLFEFDMSIHDWDLYTKTFIQGARVYLLKDPLDTIPQGRAKRLKLKIAHYSVVGVLLLGILAIAKVLWNIVL